MMPVPGIPISRESFQALIQYINILWQFRDPNPRFRPSGTRLDRRVAVELAAYKWRRMLRQRQVGANSIADCQLSGKNVHTATAGYLDSN
jgi:hypothetical protein